MMNAGVSGVLIVLAAVSCNYSIQKKGADPSLKGALTSDVSWLMENLFHQTCTSCHNGGRQSGGFKFETAADLIAAAGNGGINPGSSAKSLIFHAIVTGRMPPGARKPSTSTIEVLRCWIDAGALEDSSSCAPKNSTDALPENPDGSGEPGHPGGHHGSDDDNPRRDDGKGSDDDGGNDDDGSGRGDSGGEDGGSDAAGSSDTSDSDSPDGDSNTPVVSFQIIAPILAAKCTKCHGENASADVRLRTIEEVMNPVSGPVLVICGDSAASNLYGVLADDYMPMRAEPLPVSEKKLIADWINGGCKP